jgi:hypothetical protein
MLRIEAKNQLRPTVSSSPTGNVISHKYSNPTGMIDKVVNPLRKTRNMMMLFETIGRRIVKRVAMKADPTTRKTSISLNCSEEERRAPKMVAPIVPSRVYRNPLRGATDM